MASPDALARVRIVLSHTSHPGNIGAAARAMKTMGLARLYLVRPRVFPHEDASAFAAGAGDVLETAVMCETLEQALAGTVLAVASTARRRELSHETVGCREACHRMLAGAQAGGEVALVFGPERTGLTTREVSRCGLLATIPTGAHYASLNLAQAVQVFAYELHMAAREDRYEGAGSAALAPHEQVEALHRELERTLHMTGFLNPARPGRMMQRLRRLFARARLERQEVNILRGLLRAIRQKVE